MNRTRIFSRELDSSQLVRFSNHAVIFIVALLTAISDATVGGSVNYKMPGDVNLGGLFALNEYDDATGVCGDFRQIGYLKRLEAMVYAIDRVNRNPALLPNITLGFEIYGTCREFSSTLRECLNFIPSIRESGSCHASGEEALPIVGVLGSKTSDSSIHAALILGLYHIPQISYFSTSNELSNKNKYPYFLRTIGPDSYQVRAMIDILNHFNWNYVSFIHVDDSYGRNAFLIFESETADHGICIGMKRKMSVTDASVHYDNTVSELLDLQRGSHATVVILFVHEEMAKKILAATTRLKAQRRFIWIGSDAWGTHADGMAKGNEESAVGSFVLVPASETLPEFDEYFRSITPRTSANPWLVDFLKQYTNCTDNTESSVLPSCNDSGLLGSLDTEGSSQAMLVMDAVVAFAYALDRLYRNKCPNDTTSETCSAIVTVKGEDLLKELHGTGFTSLTNRYVNFTSDGDVPGKYFIRQMRKIATDEYTFVDVGNWDEFTTKENVIQQEILWYLGQDASRDVHTGIPKSVCSDPCKIGDRVIVNQDNQCCWTCIPCNKYEIVVDNRCISCIDKRSMVFAWPDMNFTNCIPMEPSEKTWSSAVIAVSSLGIFATLVTIGLYTYNRKNALVKASSRELSYIMFAGILLAYFTTILWAIPPTKTVCVLLRLCPSLSTSLIYVSLAMKTIRIYRIFRAGEKSAKRPKFISSKSQILFTLAITSIPLLWTVIWVVVDVPHVTAEMPYAQTRHLQTTCSRTRNDVAAIGSVVWRLGNLLVCSILAFVTRKVPENYNESRYITFCSFCSLVVYMAFSSTSFTTVDAYFRSAYASLGLILNATITLLCLYIVKIYAIYFVQLERWNIRKPLGVVPSSSEHTGNEMIGRSSESERRRDDDDDNEATTRRSGGNVSGVKDATCTIGEPAWSEGSDESPEPVLKASRKTCKGLANNKVSDS